MLTGWTFRHLRPEFRYPRCRACQLPRRGRQGGCSYSLSFELGKLTKVQVAKRKAEELEDFGGESRETTALRMLTPAVDGSEDTSSAKFSKMETDEGTAVMKAFLDEWKASVEGQGDLSEEAQVAELKRIAEEYKERFESSPWIKNLLETF